MQVKRERYTPQDVGPIPIDWDTPFLKDVSSLITNGFVGTATPYYSGPEGVKYLYGTNIRENFIDLKNIRFITKEFHKQELKTELRAGDLLTVQSGHIGTTAVVPRELDGANCHALIVTRLHKDKVSPIFLSYYLNSHIGRARMRGLEVGSTIFHINTKDLKKFRVILPTLPEQQKIAQILSTWDKAIGKLEALIAARQKRKKALMQQLLTGKKRFAGFEGVWKEKKIKEMGKVVSGGTPDTSVSEYWNGEILWMTPTDVTALDSRFIHDTNRKITEAGLKNSSATLIPRGTLLVCTRATIGLMSISTTNIATNQGFKNLIPNSKFDVNFLFYLFSYFKSEFIRYACGSTFFELSKKDFEKLVFKCPDFKEQQKIASILSTADKEIETHQKQLTALKEQKKGLMQQLLTGKKRIQMEEAA